MAAFENTPAHVVTVVIASPLEPGLVERIRDVDRGRLRVIHEPELLPRPEFAIDHRGVRPNLDGAGLERWLGLLRRADVLFDFDWYAPSEIPTNAPSVRWIQATSSGIGERVRTWGLDRTDIVLTNCAGLFGEPLAEFVVLGLLYLVKDVPHLSADQARHHWEKSLARQLGGMRVLVVGLGDLGSRISAALAALGVEVWGLRRSDGPLPPGVARRIRHEDLRSVLSEVEAVVLACPYTPETHHLIGAAEFAAMAPGSFVINVARGQVIDEPALIDALAGGHLGGAVLDVFETEPLPSDSPLWEMANVLISPHAASNRASENERIVDLFVDNLRRFLDGRPLRNVFERDRGY
jgi:phosphoglycerate dehydrogenase-like enzyme